VVRYTELRPFVVRVNDTGGSVDALIPQPASRRRRGRRPAGSNPASDAPVGGGAGGWMAGAGGRHAERRPADRPRPR
jgi:hypothetical protein